MINALVLDFDGVVIRQSEFFKQEAWKDVVAQWGEAGAAAFQEAEAHYGQGRGGDRFDILRHVLRTVGTSEDDLPRLVDINAAKFDNLVQAKILAAGVDDGDRLVISQLAERVPIYLNSATPVSALEETVRALNIGIMFAGVLGRPNTKVQNFELVAKERWAKPGDILFVGDNDSDAKAAEEFGCRFLGLGNDWNGWKKNGKPFPVISQLKEINNFLF